MIPKVTIKCYIKQKLYSNVPMSPPHFEPKYVTSFHISEPSKIYQRKMGIGKHGYLGGITKIVEHLKNKLHNRNMICHILKARQRANCPNDR
jgi:hypothetical protein